MLKFKTLCAVLAYLSFNLLNEVSLFLFRYFEVGLRVCDIVVKKFTFAIPSPDEFLYSYDSVSITPGCKLASLYHLCYNYLFFKCTHFKSVFGTALTLIGVHVEYTLLISKLQYSTV